MECLLRSIESPRSGVIFFFFLFANTQKKHWENLIWNIIYLSLFNFQVFTHLCTAYLILKILYSLCNLAYDQHLSTISILSNSNTMIANLNNIPSPFNYLIFFNFDVNKKFITKNISFIFQQLQVSFASIII